MFKLLIAATFGWLFFLMNYSAQATQSSPDANAPLLWGYKAERSSCPDSPSFLWGQASNLCIRYFTADDLEQVDTAVVVMYGDRSEYRKTPISELRDNTRMAQESLARKMAKTAGAPLLVLARPGTYGSSGYHHEKKTENELSAIEFALDALKLRYGIRRFILLGHSGGGLASAAMMTRGREDIRCAVLVSTPFNLMERALTKHADSKQEGLLPEKLRKAYEAQYDPLQHIDRVVSDPDRMIYLLGNPGDKTTPYKHQMQFAELLRLAGHRVLIEVRNASDPNLHRISYADSLAQVKMCLAHSR